MAFRKRPPPVTQQAAQFQFPTNGHLKTLITATFPDGSQIANSADTAEIQENLVNRMC